MGDAMIEQKQQAILSAIWNDLEETGPVTLDRLSVRLSDFIAWRGMPTDDAAHVLSVALPRIEKAVVAAGAKIAKEIRPRDDLPPDWEREREDRQLRIAAEALAVIAPQDASFMEAVLRNVVRDLRADGAVWLHSVQHVKSRWSQKHE